MKLLRDRLRSCGIERGHRVAAQCDDVDAMLAWHAAVEVGAVLVPVDLCDLTRVQELCCGDVDFVVVSTALDDVLEELGERVGTRDHPSPLFGISDEFTVLDVTGARHLTH